MVKNYSVPKTVTIENIGTDKVAFRYFRVNFVETLAAEDKVVLTAASSEEVAYYAALADETKGLKVTLA